MKRASVIAAILLACIVVLLGWDAYRVRSPRTHATAIKVGDTKQDVGRVLGSPASTFSPIPSGGFLSRQYETWAYGGMLELRHPFYSKFPFFWPFRVRLLGPDPDDVEVEFDTSGRVVRVSIP